MSAVMSRGMSRSILLRSLQSSCGYAVWEEPCAEGVARTASLDVKGGGAEVQVRVL